MLGTQEHYDLMDMFEREFHGMRLDREPKGSWSSGIVYQSGETNTLFLAYRKGYALGKVTGRED